MLKKDFPYCCQLRVISDLWCLGEPMNEWDKKEAARLPGLARRSGDDPALLAVVSPEHENWKLEAKALRKEGFVLLGTFVGQLGDYRNYLYGKGFRRR